MRAVRRKASATVEATQRNGKLNKISTRSLGRDITIGKSVRG